LSRSCDLTIAHNEVLQRGEDYCHVNNKANHYKKCAGKNDHVQGAQMQRGLHFKGLVVHQNQSVFRPYPVP